MPKPKTENRKVGYLMPSQAAEKLNVPVVDLAAWRMERGQGPKFFRLCGRTLYTEDSIKEFKAAQRTARCA